MATGTDQQPLSGEKELSEFVLDETVVYIINASLKLQCSVLTRSKALLLYHNFKRCHETKYDPHLVGAACISLSIKYNEEPVEYDAVIIAFFSMIEPGSSPISTIGEKFQEMKKSVALMSFLILRMVDFTLMFVLAHEYLPYFMFEFREEVSHCCAWEVFVETCMKITSDFYFTNKCLNYTAQAIASTVIQVALYLIGIDVRDGCYLKIKLKALCECEESKRQDIIEDIFKTCDVGPVAEGRKKVSQ